jgi:hypothetical protein
MQPDWKLFPILADALHALAVELASLQPREDRHGVESATIAAAY